MAFCFSDWECSDCEAIHEEVVRYTQDDGRPDATVLHCPRCRDLTSHKRLLSRPAQYTYDRPYAPVVAGGRFDTAGWRKPPPLPELPPDASMNQARDFLNSKEFKEIKAERWDVAQQNKAKRARAEVMKRDPNIDLRNTPLPGDPPKDRIVGKTGGKLVKKWKG